MSEEKLQSPVFVENPDKFRRDDTLIIEVSADLKTPFELQAELGRLLHFSVPQKNWDSFRSYMRELEDVSQDRIVIYHWDFPSFPEERDLVIYVDMLEGTNAFWHEVMTERPRTDIAEEFQGIEMRKHEMLIAFHPGLKARLEELQGYIVEMYPDYDDDKWDTDEDVARHERAQQEYLDSPIGQRWWPGRQTKT